MAPGSMGCPLPARQGKPPLLCRSLHDRPPDALVGLPVVVVSVTVELSHSHDQCGSPPGFGISKARPAREGADSHLQAGHVGPRQTPGRAAQPGLGTDLLQWLYKAARGRAQEQDSCRTRPCRRAWRLCAGMHPEQVTDTTRSHQCCGIACFLHKKSAGYGMPTHQVHRHSHSAQCRSGATLVAKAGTHRHPEARPGRRRTPSHVGAAHLRWPAEPERRSQILPANSRPGHQVAIGTHISRRTSRAWLGSQSATSSHCSTTAGSRRACHPSGSLRVHRHRASTDSIRPLWRHDNDSWSSIRRSWCHANPSPRNAGCGGE